MENNKGVIQGFKEFILRGNAIDLAVGVVIGAAFGKVVDVIVKGFLTPLLAVVIQKPNFTQLYFQIGRNRFAYGSVIDEIISFVLVAVAIYFFVIIPMNRITARVNRGEESAAPSTKQCSFCINEIHIEAKRCPFCTAILENENTIN